MISIDRDVHLRGLVKSIESTMAVTMESGEAGWKNMYGNMSFHFISFGGTAPHPSLRKLLSLGKVEVPVLVLSKSA